MNVESYICISFHLDWGWNSEDFGGGFNWMPPNKGYEKFEPVEDDQPVRKTKQAAPTASVAQAIEVPSTAATTEPAAPQAFNPKKDNLAALKFKIGQVQLPKQLRENIVSVLKGTAMSLLSFLVSLGIARPDVSIHF